MHDRDRRILLDFVELCALPQCPICALVSKAELRTLQVYCAEGAGDEMRRADIRAARGLCVRHSDLLQNARDAMAAAVTAFDVLTNLQRDLQAVSQARWRRRSRMTKPLPCPVCADVRRYDRAVCAGVVAWADQPELTGALATSAGLCAPHLRWLVAHTNVPTAILDAQHVAWSRLHAELAEFIRKRDDRFRHEGDADERDAWKRAWRTIAGSVEVPDTKE